MSQPTAKQRSLCFVNTAVVSVMLLYHTINIYGCVSVAFFSDRLYAEYDGYFYSSTDTADITRGDPNTESAFPLSTAASIKRCHILFSFCEEQKINIYYTYITLYEGRRTVVFITPPNKVLQQYAAAHLRRRPKRVVEVLPHKLNGNALGNIVERLALVPRARGAARDFRRFVGDAQTLWRHVVGGRGAVPCCTWPTVR